MGAVCALLLSGCAASVSPGPAIRGDLSVSPVHEDLQALPPPAQKVFVAVYDFPDQTGQFKPPESVQTLSRAVTQGAASILVDVLQETAGGGWFAVVERTSLQNLLRERQIVDQARSRFVGSDGKPLPPLGPLRYAGILLEGGIIGYDSNTLTGGLGARFLGVGGDVQYREDVVTVYLRAVSTQTGEVLRSIRTSKRIISYGASANAFRFISFRDLLEAEGGWTSNEPQQVALRQAIELAVYGLIIEGAEAGLWSFADRQAGAQLSQDWRRRNSIRPLDGAPELEQLANVPPARVIPRSIPAQGPPFVAPAANGGEATESASAR